MSETIVKGRLNFHDVLWVYPRPQGDIELYAPSKEVAAETLMQHGFTNVDTNKLRRGAE